MKTIIEKEIGADGAKVGVYTDGVSFMLIESYPVSKILSPVDALVDKAIDKIEQLIPGDQTGIAAGMKADADAALAKLFAEAVNA